MTNITLNLTADQATALATLLGATGGNADLDNVYDALVDRGAGTSGRVTFEENDMADEFPNTPEFVINVVL